MNKRILKKFSTALISLSVLCGIAVLLACTWSEEEESGYYAFFIPETSHADVYAPFYRDLTSILHVYPLKENQSGDFYEANVEEWAAFFNNVVTANDLYYLLYEAPIAEIDTLIFFVKDDKYPVSKKLWKNSILKVSDKVFLKEFLFYLGYAKRCEPYATYAKVWDWHNKDTARDLSRKPLVAAKFIDGGQKASAKLKSGFIKQRYAFQIARLYYLSGNYAECVEFCKQQLFALMPENNMKCRTMGYEAGALYKMKKYSEANYLYSLIYDQSDIMKTTAYQSFHPVEETDWQQCLKMAKNNREKEVLWHLLGIYADPLRAMKEIYAINPSSDLLDLLLVRAANIEEEKFVPRSFSFEKQVNENSSKPFEAIKPELIDFVKNVADKGNTNKPYLWNLVAGYFVLANTEYAQADAYFNKALASGKEKDSVVEEQIVALKMVSKIAQLKKPDIKFEQEITSDLKKLFEGAKHTVGTQHIYEWTLTRLAGKYKSSGEIMKAECLAPGTTPTFYRDNIQLDAMLKYMDEPVKTEFDKFILSVYPYQKKVLFEVQAVNLLYQYKFKEAVQKFEECPGSGDQELLADPFLIHIKDCHERDHEAPKTTTYTNLSFAKRMQWLNEQIQLEPENAAEYYYEMANGLYNMTYFGNARTIYQTDVRAYSDGIYGNYDPNTIGWGKYTYGDVRENPVLTDCKKAEECYKKAMELSTDREFKAKCCFMAAKAEQNAFIMSKPDNYVGDFRAGKYFKLLKLSYKDTEYYKDIIAECGYFKTYASSR